MRYRCLIVDDDPLAVKILSRYLESVPQVELLGHYSHALQVMDHIGKEKPDLLFLDIELPRIPGIDFVKTLQNAPRIIFTTVHHEFAVEAFELGAVDYLIKPFSFERFLKAMNKFFDISSKGRPIGLNSTSGFMCFKTERKVVRVALENILYIESFKDYIIIHRLNEPDLRVKQAINCTELMLSKELFARIHRSFIVSVNKITAYSNYHVELGKVEIPIGRKYKGSIPGWGQAPGS